MKRMTIVSLAGCLGLLVAASTCFAQQYTVTDLGTLGGTYSVAFHLNNRGDAVGFSQITGSAVSDAFLYSNGIMTDLGTLGGGGSQARGINNTGQVVGFSYTTGNGPFSGPGIGHAFIYSGGVMTDLGTLGGSPVPPMRSTMPGRSLVLLRLLATATATLFSIAVAS